MKFKRLFKYKFTLLFLLGCLLLLVPFREGFSSGQYDYLAPHEITVLDPTIEANFTTAFNTTNASYPKIAPVKSADISSYKTSATLDEFNSYIQNNKWPYSSYLTTYLTQNEASIVSALTPSFSPVVPTIAMLQQVFPTRLVYSMFIKSKESTQTPPPLSYEIFMGTKPPDSTPSQLSADNYQKLVSLCTDVK
jgi:hypothetical protein